MNFDQQQQQGSLGQRQSGLNRQEEGYGQSDYGQQGDISQQNMGSDSGQFGGMQPSYGGNTQQPYSSSDYSQQDPSQQLGSQGQQQGQKSQGGESQMQAPSAGSDNTQFIDASQRDQQQGSNQNW
ncbi:hypothetical protein BZG36_04452 [Bifiguratus adelaidae]|uniref:Uncharacterized protein n=1 Tax=Bifiguratus adelaidae TaxID=1938954 RepID=A0A261XVA9_9FUNG|nr:hypothetical protein BZG36_04452 [Bifiguratus adelaidae]